MNGLIPRPLLSDAYTLGAGTHVSAQAKQYSAYQMCFRMRPDWMDQLGCESRFIFHGFQRILKSVICPQLTRWEIDETDRFLKNFHVGGNAFTWDKEMWLRIISENEGRFPLRIYGLADGAVCFPGEPVLQIEASHGYGELAGFFEVPILHAWASSERATLMRHLLEYNKTIVKRCVGSFLSEPQLNDMAASMIHDFGARASSCPQEMALLGLAHLTSHSGTDTVAGAYLAWRDGNVAVGHSIKALAHRIVQGFEHEEDAYLSLYESEPNTFTSHVGDCYNYYRAIDQYLVPLAKKAKETGGVIVARPDSGDPLEQVLYTLNAAIDAGLSVALPNGLIGMTSLRVIQGDGMTFQAMSQINEALFAKGISPFHSICYGIGGWLRNTLQRDNFGATLKLCAVGTEATPVMKFSHTPGKGSIPGLVKVVRSKDPNDPSVRSLTESGDSAYHLWFDGQCNYYIRNEPFQDVRNRVLNNFYDYPQPKEIFSPNIKQMKKDLHYRYTEGAV